MNRREKMLAAAVGLLVLVALLNVGFNRIVKRFSDRSEKIAQLKSEIESKETVIHRGKSANRILQVCRERSLPSDPQLANSRYRAWLHEWIEKANIRGENVTWARTSRYQDAHDRHMVNMDFEATLPQLVDLLYHFYSVDFLHRIQFAKIAPSQGNRLAVNFTIEAISMPDAAKDQPLSARKADRLAFQDLKDYQNVIVTRNFYGRGNQPPKFASSSTQRGHVGEPLDVTLKVDDPEKGEIHYRLEKSDIAGLHVNERSGRVEWTPDRTGEFEIQVCATDDGIPAKEASQTVRLEITEKPKVEERRERPSFDEAKYTFVTGIVEINGRRQVWLTVRSQGKWLRLYEGETFHVGTFEGKIVKIHPRHVEIESGDAVWSVRYGQNLSEGQEIIDRGPDVATARH
jgi:hypothetical protein